MIPIATRLLNDLRYRRTHNDHSIVAVQGDPGIGKSHCAICIARNVEPSFKPDNIFYGRDELFEVVAPAPKGGVYILDEGTNAAMNRTWQDREQTELMQVFNTIRQRKHTIFWNQPNVQRLDVVLREDLITHRINCIRRGSARVRTKVRDRDGEPKGWKTWRGFLGWPNLDAHPVFGETYMDAKEAAYHESLRTFKQRRNARKHKKEDVLQENAALMEAYT